MRQMVRWLLVVASLCSASVLSAQVPAQPAEVTVTLGLSAAPLYGPWKFHIGDSPLDPKTGQPLWAEPDFDDSAWENVDLTPKGGSTDPTTGVAGYVPGWTTKGHPGYWGYAWYRMRVQVNLPLHQQLALAGPPDFDDAYQLFANGSLAGSFGGFGTHRPTVYYAQPAMFPVPDSGATQVIAFRFWMEPSTLLAAPETGGFHSPPVLGELGVVRLTYQSNWLAVIKDFSARALLILVFGLLALLAFSLILFDRFDSVYLWMGLLFLLTASQSFFAVISEWSLWLSIPESNLLFGVIVPLNNAAWVIVLWIWFGRGVFRRLPQLVAVLTALNIICSVLGNEVFVGLIAHSAAERFNHASVVLAVVLMCLLAWIVINGIRRQGLEGWLVLPVVLLSGFSTLLTIEPSLQVREVWFPFGVQFSLRAVTDLLISLVIGILLVRRLLRSLERQRQMALDVKQAQEVQQVILPEDRVILHGFEIESEYRPAREVGGDFFQIIPDEKDGSVLIVAGDVTGKGLKAGMLVALLVGAIRTAVRFTPNPAAILDELNQRLLGRHDALATCLALRIERDGSATLANAGHLPPYINGKPMEMEGSLPLGMVKQLECSIHHFQLAPKDRLLLLSDGVAEATDPDGQLFGFERVLELVRTQPSAARIAETAQAFGQEDDISVIAVTRIPAPALA